MRSLKSRVAVSRVVTVIFVVVIIVAAGVGFLILAPKPTAPTSASTTAPPSSGFGPTNSSELIDDAQVQTPDSLDPATGITHPDYWVWNNVFQQLIELTGENSTQGVVVPALALNYTVQAEQNYTFYLRPGVTFSNGDPENAAIVWFSFVRNLYMGQAEELGYFVYITESPTTLTTTGLSLPWGLLNAVQSATGLPTTTNYALAENVLNNMLSNFNPNNATIQKIMSYPDQAYSVSGPMTFVARSLKPYPTPFFLSIIAQMDAAIIDPVYVDAHGGVQANTPNTYFNNNGGPGTGPYYIASIGPGFSTVVEKANPTYWGLKATNIPVVCEPASIPVVVVNFGLPSNSRSEAFDTNQAQISYVDPSVLSQMWIGYKYKQYTSFNQVFDDFGPGPTTEFFIMNVAQYPTNNTDFRLAVVHAVNYTQILNEAYSYNGTLLAENYLGPLSPLYGPYYNPDHLPLYSYDLPLAIGYMNKAGQQEGFSLTLPNGTVIGDTSASPLGPLRLIYTAPITPAEETIDTIIESDLSQIGLAVAPQGATFAEEYAYTTPQTTPTFVNNLGWGADWPDPVLGMILDVVTPISLETWMNVTQVNNLISSLAYETNQTAYIQGIAQIYNITYNYAPDIWLPTWDNYFLVQPYLHGFIYSPYSSPSGMYWYNTMYYSTSTANPSPAQQSSGAVLNSQPQVITSDSKNVAVIAIAKTDW